MLQLHRITTEYIEAEDRIRLSGENEEGQSIVLWLTQRLLSQVISHLLTLIDQRPNSLRSNLDTENTANSLIQGFAQQAAESELSPELPVQSTDLAHSWLVLEVDLALNPEGTLVLVFKRDASNAIAQDDTGKASLTLEAKQLRQWLGIVHAQWQKAGWPPSLWPSWMNGQAPSDASNPLH